MASRIHENFAKEIIEYLEDPLAIIHYLFWNENSAVRIDLKEPAIIRDHLTRPVYSAELDFYYKNNLVKTLKIVNQRSARQRGWIESLRAYVDIKRWYSQRNEPSAHIEIPIEFPFGDLGMIRTYHEFHSGPLAQVTQQELDQAKKFLYESGRLSVAMMENEFHLNTKTKPPSLIIIDFESFPGMP